MGETTSAMTTLGSIFTQFMTWMSSIVETIASNEILMLGLGIWAVGAAIGLAKRIIGH